MLQVAKRVLKKKLGFRYLMDVIPLDATLVKGSHGRVTDDPQHGAILIAANGKTEAQKIYKQTDIFDIIYQHFI
jgi:hypothetical protein